MLEPDETVLVFANIALRSFQGIVKVTDKRNAGHADTSTQLRLWFEVWRKVQAVSSKAGPSQERLRAVKLESALEAKELQLQTLPGFAFESSTLLAETS